MSLNIEESNILIEKAYKEVVLEMVERCEKNMSSMNLINSKAHIRQVYLNLKNHLGLMDVFASRITNRIAESKLIKNLDIENLVLDSNGHGNFNLKIDDQIICKINLKGRQSDAFNTETESLEFNCDFHESKDKYPYISFFNDNLNKLHAEYFENIGKDYKIVTSINKVLKVCGQLYIPSESIQDINEKDFSNLKEAHYHGCAFRKKTIAQGNLEYIYEMNKSFLEDVEIGDFDTFKMILRNFKIYKKFFKSIGLFLTVPNMFIEKGNFFFVLKNKNKDCLTLKFPINSEIKEIAESKILDHNDKPTIYTIRDYIKNPEEVIDYIKMIAY